MEPVEIPPAPDPDPVSDPLSLAVVAEVVERGYQSVAVEDVTFRAGLTVAEFHSRYTDLDDCVLDTYERLIAAFQRRSGAAFNRHADWRTALRAAAYVAADWLEQYPDAVEFGTSEVLRMNNEMARVRREEVFVWCAQMIDRGREAAPDPEAVPEAAAMIAIGSILQLLTHRWQEGAEIRPYDSARESIYGVVLTYLGEDAAREELHLPRPEP